MDFDTFWEHYPRREGKATARKAFAKLEHIGLPLELIIKDLEQRYAGIDLRYVPHASTYLNQRRWEDEDSPASILNHAARRIQTWPKPRSGEPPRASDDEVAMGLEILRQALRDIKSQPAEQPQASRPSPLGPRSK